MDLHRLRPVLDQDGPYLTLDLDVSRTAEDAAERAEARWTRVRHFLEERGADPGLVDDLRTRVTENTHVPGEVRRTTVATRSGVLLDDVRPGHDPRPEVLELADLPDVAAWVDHHDQALSFVLALVDRTGSDLSVHRASQAGAVATETVTGQTDYIRKVPQGDWAHKEFQNTAEDRWEKNARLVAEQVRRQARRHGTRAVLVAGEVRARAEVLRALEAEDAQVLGTVLELEAGGRAAGSSEQALWSEVDEHVRRLLAERDADLTARLEEALGRCEGAVQGLGEVLSALAMARVDDLVVDLAALQDRTVTPAEHEGLPLPAPAAGADSLPADRVLVAAACLTGARLTAVPASTVGDEGVAALLRWSQDADPGTPTATGTGLSG